MGKRIFRWGSTWLIGTIIVGTILAVWWFCLGFYYLPDNWIAYTSTRSDYLYDIDRVVYGDNQIHWRPWGITELSFVQLKFRLPTFDRALAETIVWNKLYQEAMKNYQPPESEKDLKDQVELIVAYLNQKAGGWGLVESHTPSVIFFEKYEKEERWILAGYYQDGIKEDLSGLLYDFVSLNENYLKGRPWQSETYLHTLVHELHHAQGPANALVLWNNGNEVAALIVFWNGHNETITQIRSIEVCAELMRENIPGFDAAFYDAMEGQALRAAYFLMQREIAGYPWNAYPYYADIETSEYYTYYFEKIGEEFAERGKRPEIPLCYCDEKSLPYLGLVERLDILVNRWIKSRYTRDWQKRFWKVYMNLYPTTPERRALRRQYSILRDKNPYIWSASVYQYWWLPYLNFNIALSEGYEGDIDWYWSFCYWIFCSQYQVYEDVLPTTYFNVMVKKEAERLVNLSVVDRLQYRDWVLKYYDAISYTDTPYADSTCQSCVGPTSYPRTNQTEWDGI